MNKKVIGDIRAYLALGATFIILMLVIFFYIKVLFGVKEIYVTAFIAFLGSIAGGSLTLVGVLVTIKHEKDNRLRDSYNRQIDIIDKVLDDAKGEISVIYYLGRSKVDSLTEDDQELIIDSLRGFYKALENNIWEIKRILELEIAKQVFCIYNNSAWINQIRKGHSKEFKQEAIKITSKDVLKFKTLLENYQSELYDKLEKIK